MTASKKTGGLAGVSAGETAISTVGKEGKGLTYRGYSINDLAAKGLFEETAYLLIYGKLPTRDELAAYMSRLKALRDLPQTLKEVLEKIPATTHPMDVMRTGCSMLGTLEPETNENNGYRITDRLLAVFPAILVYWWKFATDHQRIDCVTDEAGIGAHFLHLLHGKVPEALQACAMDASLTLYAEHEFNASTFAARITTATLSDFYSGITSGIGTLRGPLHGGANEAAMDLIERFKTPTDAAEGMARILTDGGKVMGFGHRVYSISDPRSDVIKEWARKLAEATGDKVLFPVSEKIESIMWSEKKLFPNLDFYSASVYHMLGIPTTMFTPIFVMARTAGWAAHMIEQRGNNRLIRPSADYTGMEPRAWQAIEERA